MKIDGAANAFYTTRDLIAFLNSCRTLVRELIPCDVVTVTKLEDLQSRRVLTAYPDNDELKKKFGEQTAIFLKKNLGKMAQWKALQDTVGTLQVVDKFNSEILEYEKFYQVLGMERTMAFRLGWYKSAVYDVTLLSKDPNFGDYDDQENPKLQRFIDQACDGFHFITRWGDLTKRQQEVVQLLGVGWQIKEAGKKLGIAGSTVSGHLYEATKHIGFQTNHKVTRAWLIRNRARLAFDADIPRLNPDQGNHGVKGFKDLPIDIEVKFGAWR